MRAAVLVGEGFDIGEESGEAFGVGLDDGAIGGDIHADVGLDIDEANVAETIMSTAADRDAAAIVVGSRGHGAVRALFGSTSRHLVGHSTRPVLVVRAPAGESG